jgi:ferric-dicitrate binding protein FerR (iron transport regulator)
MIGTGQLLTKEKSRVGMIAFYRVAAALILLAVLSYALLQIPAKSRAEEKIMVIHSVSSKDGNKKIIFSDSSIVWLKGNTSIVYPEKFDGTERSVRLIGEALFEVSRDPDHPFVIQCGGLVAKVLGTSFNIKSSETEIEVIVLTGKVALTSKGGSGSLIVHSNEKAVYNEAQNQMIKFSAKENEKTAKTTGTEYSMRFNATAMNEIIRRIEGKFEVRVSLSDERLNNCTITADFTDQSLDRTLSMIAQTLEIKYEMRNSHVMLVGVGCD